jgi:hypothetical protein
MYNNEDLGKLFRLWMTTFGDKQTNDTYTEDDIREKLNVVVKFYEVTSCIKVTEGEYNYTLRLLYTRLNIKGMGKGTPVIDIKTFRPWLESRNDIDHFYWNRYRTYLIEHKGWNSHVVNSLGDVNTDILDLIGNPANTDHWKIRGLVMGDVQSGKTANYTALCNKAMDAGYRVIIVLAGSQENLRQQTQNRLDKELVGLDSQYLMDKIGRKLPIGVGDVDPKKFVTTFTSKDYDFDQKILNSLGLQLKNCTEPALFVVKKQKQRLNYLTKWLYKHNANSDGLIDIPMLLIDDEADNASVNTRDGDPTTINKCIRKLLALFTRTSYIGYTATPYANIFIDPDLDDKVLKNDLFPSDFIYPLRTPQNYIGNVAIYGDEAKHENMLMEIDDAEECIPLKHKGVDDIQGLPLSLYEAMRYFLLANAIMDANAIRKDIGVITSHRSMLINISRLTDVHEYILFTMKEWLEKIKSEIMSYAALEPEEACRILGIKNLKMTWDKHKMADISPVDWKTLQQEFLNNSITHIDAVQVNQNTGSASLDYNKFNEKGLRVIAIGGNSLSRGLTLEGLCVSYFYRNSRMYDTLLQMGRWFGYRDGYDNLCKIWMSDEAIESYCHITKATTELRDELQYMRNNKMTPSEFGLMVRSKPEVVDFIARGRVKKRMQYNLTVTAKNKMKSTTEIVRVISIRGDMIETAKIPNNYSQLVNNYKLVSTFISKIDSYKNKDEEIHDGKHQLWVGVPVSEVAKLVRSFSADPLSSTFQGDSLSAYIEQADGLSHWDVAVPSGSGITKWPGMESLLKPDFKPESRFIDIDSQNRCVRINGAKQRVGSKPCTKYGLKKLRVKEIVDGIKEGDGISDKDFLVPDRNPLLLLHFISMHTNTDQKSTNFDKEKSEKNEKAINEVREKLDKENACLVALGLGIPHDIAGSRTEKIRYVVNKIKMQQIQEEIEEQKNYDD